MSDPVVETNESSTYTFRILSVLVEAMQSGRSTPSEVVNSSSLQALRMSYLSYTPMCVRIYAPSLACTIYNHIRYPNDPGCDSKPRDWRPEQTQMAAEPLASKKLEHQSCIARPEPTWTGLALQVSNRRTNSILHDGTEPDQ